LRLEPEFNEFLRFSGFHVANGAQDDTLSIVEGPAKASLRRNTYDGEAPARVSTKLNMTLLFVSIEAPAVILSIVEGRAKACFATSLRRDNSGSKSQLSLIIASFFFLLQPFTCFSKAIAWSMLLNSAENTSLTGRLW